MKSLKGHLYRFLRQSERYTKVDMVYLASGGFWSILGVIGSGAIALGTAVAFANLLPKEVYGTYQYALAVVGLLGILSLPGLKTAISYASSRGNDGSFLAAIAAKIRWGFVSAACALAISLYYLLQQNAVLFQVFFVIAVFLPWWDVYGNYVPYLQGKRQFKPMIIYELVTQAVNALAIVLVMLYTDSVTILVAAFFVSWTLSRYLLFRRTLNRFPPNQQSEPSLLSYSKHLSLMNIITTVASTVDKILLWQFLGPIQVAIYTFSLTVPQRAVSAFASINRMYFPKAAVQDLRDIRSSLLPKMGALSVVTLLTALGYVLAAPYLFSLAFPEYIEAVPYTQLAAVLIALQPLSLLATALSAHARKEELYIYNILPPAIQIALLCILIPTFHIYGALIAILIAQVVEGVLLLVLFIRASRSSPKGSGT